MSMFHEVQVNSPPIPVTAHNLSQKWHTQRLQVCLQIAADANQPPPIKTETKTKKLKKVRHKKRIIKAKSLFTPKTTVTVARATTSAKEPDPIFDDSNLSTDRSPLRLRASMNVSSRKPNSPLGHFRTKTTTTRKSSPNTFPKPEGYPKEPIVHRRKIVKKRRLKRKKLSNAT